MTLSNDHERHELHEKVIAAFRVLGVFRGWLDQDGFSFSASEGWVQTSRAQRKPVLLPDVSGVLLVRAERR